MGIFILQCFFLRSSPFNKIRKYFKNRVLLKVEMEIKQTILKNSLNSSHLLSRVVRLNRLESPDPLRLAVRPDPSGLLGPRSVLPGQQAQVPQELCVRCLLCESTLPSFQFHFPILKISCYLCENPMNFKEPGIFSLVISRYRDFARKNLIFSFSGFRKFPAKTCLLSHNCSLSLSFSYYS